MSNPTSPHGATAWSPDRPVTASKRSLIAVSHVIERALLDGPLTAPTVVIAMFQRHAYVQRAYDVYARLAAAGAVVVLGFADGEAHQVPPGCHGIVLDPTEPLADEWTVIAVGPQAGAYLVATDAHRFDPTEATLEAGREFDGRWGYSRVQAGNELARMRAALGSRLGTAVTTTIDHLLALVMPAGGAASGSRGTDGEMWATISLHRMIERMQDARAGSRILRAQLVDAHAAVTARTAAHVDQQSGLTSPEFLSRWTDTGRPTALPVGVAVIDIAALDGADERYEPRAVWHASRRVAAALTEPIGPVDAAVRLSDREFALVVPGASTRHLRHLVTAVGEQLELASDGYPGISLTATVASVVTLTRPLPLDDLHLALGSPTQPSTTLAGDPITVVSTADVHQTANGRPITDALPRVRVHSVPTTSPDDAPDVPSTATPSSAGTDLTTPAAGIRAVAANGTAASVHGSDGRGDADGPGDTTGGGDTGDTTATASAGHASAGHEAAGHEAADPEASEVTTIMSAPATAAAPEAGTTPDTAVTSDTATPGTATPGTATSGPATSGPATSGPATPGTTPEQPTSDAPTPSPAPSPRPSPSPTPRVSTEQRPDDVTKRADRTMNVLAGLPRRNRRNGQHARDDTNNGSIGPVDGTNGFPSHGTFGEPPAAL